MVSLVSMFTTIQFDSPIIDLFSNQDGFKAATKAHVSHNSGNNEWYTPPIYVELARTLMGSIDTDPASSAVANQIVKAAQFFDIESNGLTQQWNGNVWMNPPYAQPLIMDFCSAITSKYDSQEIIQAVVLVNNATETKWFQTLMGSASAVCFPKSRIRFLKPDGTKGDSPLQGQAIVYFGNAISHFYQTFKYIGMVMEVTR